MSRGFFRSTAVVGVTTLLSRITGLLRDMVFAAIFPGGHVEAFLSRTRSRTSCAGCSPKARFRRPSCRWWPNIGKRSTDEVRELVDGRRHARRRSGDRLGARRRRRAGDRLVLRPGFLRRARQFDLAVAMLRWTFPYLFFISLTALAGGVLNS